MIGKLDALQANAEIAAPDTAPGEQLIDHAVDRGGGNGDTGNARKRRRGDADGFSRGVHHEAAGGAGVEGEVEADVAVQAAAAPGAPGRAESADNSHGGVDAGILGAAD